jgi:hypothetical protein
MRLKPGLLDIRKRDTRNNDIRNNFRLDILLNFEYRVSDIVLSIYQKKEDDPRENVPVASFFHEAKSQSSDLAI